MAQVTVVVQRFDQRLREEAVALRQAIAAQLLVQMLAQARRGMYPFADVAVFTVAVVGAAVAVIGAKVGGKVFRCGQRRVGFDGAGGGFQRGVVYRRVVGRDALQVGRNGNVAGARDIGVRTRFLLDFFQERIACERFLHFLRKFGCRQLQQLDGLLQSRG